ncbi:hypothetical protein BGX34_002890 [Mortierella sp. NVP85]|nr:hypothetical protein BGX34_002890 [Mortierella sp. NVP85]
MEHPTVTCLSLRGLSSNREPAFWDALLGFHNLRELTMSSFEVFGSNVDKFWQLCTRLVRLDIFIQHNPDVAPPQGEYPNLRHLGVYAMSIVWRTIVSHEKGFITAMSELLEANALPNLERLLTGTKGINNDLFTRLIQSLPPQINTLTIRLTQDILKMDFATLIQPPFSNLRVLELDWYTETKSNLAQVIMSSCPLLEKLVVPLVDAHVLTEGDPWVCLKLKVLDLSLCFSPPNTVSHLQPLVFDRLSKLTRLEELYLRGPEERGNYETVDLRLEYGLHKLSTLRLLRSITLRNTREWMGDAEVDWILRHWKNLMVFDGRLHMYNERLRGALVKRLEGHEIDVVRVCYRSV